MKKNMTDMNTCLTTKSNQVIFMARSITAVMAVILLLAVCLTKIMENSAVISRYKYSSDAAVQMWTSDSTAVWGGGDTCWIK